MDNIFDKIIVFICCAVFMSGVGINSYSVIPIMIALIISSIISFFDKAAITISGYITYLLLTFIFPELLFFLPLLLYDLYMETYKYVASICVIPIIYNIGSIKTSSFLLIAILCIFVYIVKRRMSMLTELKRTYTSMRDNMSEEYDKLYEKNKDLLERQEYEVSNATLNERNRIAREIHDTVGHIISRSLLQIGAIITITKDDAAKDALISVKETLSTGMDTIRDSIHNLHEDSMKLEDKLTEIINNFDYCDVEFKYDIYTDFNMKAKYTIIFIIKEALSNVIKHSHADHVKITLCEINSFYQITVHDNGHGSARATLGNSAGMGISGFYERVSSLNGNINISNDNGFKIFITLPKDFAAKKIGD